MTDPAPKTAKERFREWVSTLGWAKGLGLTALIFCVLITIVVCRSHLAETAIQEYTDAAPQAIQDLTLSSADIGAFTNRLVQFKEHVLLSHDAEELTLSVSELNYLLRHQNMDCSVSNLFCQIENGQLKGQFSLPLEDMHLPGRFLNGDAILSVCVTGGRLYVFMESVLTKGHDLPELLMRNIRMGNLAESVNKDPALHKVFLGIKSVDVEGDHVVVRPLNRLE